MLRDNHFRLVTLGRLTLVGGGGEEEASLARRRLKLAVLAVLAMARRPVSRDTLLEMFWGADDETRARHSLSNALSSLRGVLGQSSITTRDTLVGLGSDLLLDLDALELAEAVEGKDYARAVELYGGPFMEGVRVDESPSFEQWVFRERRRLEALFLKAAAQQCNVLARGRRWAECGTLAARWLDTDPLSTDAALFLLNATKAPGSRSALAGALEEYERLRQRLTREFDVAPNKAVIELAERIREELATKETTEGRVPVAEVVPVQQAVAREPEARAAVSAVPAITEPDRARGNWRGAWHRPLLGACVLAVLAVVVTFSIVNRPGAGGSAGERSGPVIAVFSMDLRTEDSTLSWLSDGLPLMIDGKLERVEGLTVVPAERVRAVTLRSGRAGRGPLPDAVARDLARRVGATHVARGSLGRDGGNLVLELTLHDVSSGALLRNAVLTRANALEIADEAAARIVAAANVTAPGRRFTELETSSVEAYQHFMRALEAERAGQRSEAKREYDAAIALDSGFITALQQRLQHATNDQDTVLTARLRSAMTRNAHRATEFDRMHRETFDAFHGGEHARSEALARSMVARYPRDPRAISVLHSIVVSHGRFEEAEALARQALALDSLAMAAGTGPCSQCNGISSLLMMRAIRGNLPEAADWARRWIREQPDAASAWSSLAWMYSFMQRPDSALQFMQRAVSLSGGDVWARREYARMLLIARRYAEADSAIRVVEQMAQVLPTNTTADLRSLQARERGRYRESMQIMTRYASEVPLDAGFAEMVRADNLRLTGNGAEGARRYEALIHGTDSKPLPLPFPAMAARGICWMHALAADAQGASADTALLRAVADSLEAGCRTSYYGRDWILHHHVRGLIAMRAGRTEEAVKEFRQAFWSPVEGWSRTTIELAKALGAVGKPREAIATLRSGYATRLDAMGRYAPISEVDYWMSRMFAQAGEHDSARVYAGYVREAWREADPEVRALLDQLQH